MPKPETHTLCSQSRPPSWISVSVVSTITHSVTQPRCLRVIPEASCLPLPHPNLANVGAPETFPYVSTPCPPRKALPRASHQHPHQDSREGLLNTARLPESFPQTTAKVAYWKLI